MFAMAALIIALSQNAYAEIPHDKVEFASYLEETLGHFWAIEQNLDEKNAELALVHATHPIAELYDLMKPHLKQADPQLDTQIQDTLMQLQHKANTEVSREQAQKALDDAREVVEIARSTVVGDELSNDPLFKAELMKSLIETSILEYREAVSDEMIKEMAEFQDGSAFVWRSEQIFRTIESDVDPHTADEINEYYEELWGAYHKKADPIIIDATSDEIINEVNKILGVEMQEEDLLVYVDNIQDLLMQTKQAYENNDSDSALSFATKAYLDNFEFLEGPLKESGNDEIVQEIETMLREELRTMIKNGVPSDEVNQQVDAILEKMDEVKVAVPEFGPIAIIALAVSITGIIIATSKKTRLNIISKR